MFDEMTLVVGNKDIATTDFPRELVIQVQKHWMTHLRLLTLMLMTYPKISKLIPHMWPQVKQSHRKRIHATMIEDVVYQDLSTQLGKVAFAIEKISKNQLNFGSLYEEIMKMDMFEETMLAYAFDQLNGDENQARSFMLKIDKLRRQWLQNFFDNYLCQF